MKKSSKCFILLGTALATIGISTIIPMNVPKQNSAIEKEMQAYNHKPANILDNVFTEGNTKYLPIIFDTPDTPLSVERVREEFKKAGLTIKSISPTFDGNVVTNTKITVNENSNTYTVIVYGDVDGDGYADTMDAYEIVSYVKNATKNPINGIFLKAGNVCNDEDTEVDTMDAYQIVLFQKRKISKLVEIEPQSTKELDKTKPVISFSKGDTITVPVKSSFTTTTALADATATDNYDGTITGKLKVTGVENVNTSKVGSYTITYTVTDSNGNTATKTRTVKVVDKTKPVITVTGGKIAIQAGSTFTKQQALSGVTATDNYDGNITSKIQVNYTVVNTNVPKEYTITYTVTDSSNNTATATRIVEVVDKVNSIELAQAPQNLTYNYGATKLDLTGAKLKINAASGSTTVDITENMLSNYNLNQEGTQNVTITYSGIKLENAFTITVLSKITGLELVTDGRDNIQEVTDPVAGTYFQTNAKEDFILGVIRSNNTTGSKLTAEDLKIAPVTDVTIKAEADANGNIVLKGKVSKAGSYTVNISISYKDGTTVTLDALNIRAQNSMVVDVISLQEFANNEKVRSNKPAQKQLTVTNIHGDQIEITEDMVQVTGKTGGINAEPVIENGKVKAMKITTTETNPTQTTNTFNLVIGGKTETITVPVAEKLVLTRVEIANSIPLYSTVEEANEAIQRGENVEKTSTGNIYTKIPVKFYNQEGVMSMPASMVDLTNAPGTLTDDQIAITQNTVDCTVKGTTTIRQASGMSIKVCGEDGTILSGGSTSDVGYIAVSIDLENPILEVVLSSLMKDGKLQLKWQNQSGNCEVSPTVTLKEISELTIDESVADVTKNSSDMYEVEVGKGEFTLGSVAVGVNEGPLTQDMLGADIKALVGDKTGITISYEEVTNGNNKSILLKGEATKTGTYEVKPYVMVGNSKLYIEGEYSVYVKAEGSSKVTDISLENANVEMQRAIDTNLIIKSALNPDGGETVERQYIKVTPSSGINVTMLNNGMPVAEANLTTKVNGLRIQSKGTVTSDTKETITITLYEGQADKEVTIPVEITVYKPTIGRIEVVAPAVTLYKTEQSSGTVLANSTVYTKVSIKAYVDSTDKKPVTLTKDMFQLVADEASQVEDKINIIMPKITLYQGATATSQKTDVASIEYFDEIDEVCGDTGIVENIGLAIPTPLSVLTYNEDEFNANNTITVKYKEQAKTITVSYEK